MKTVNAIIERLQKEHGDNGCYYLLTRFVEVFEKAIADSKAAYETNSWLFIDGLVDEKHSCLDGFLWGLRAADLITDEEREKAQDEIKDLRWPPKKEEAAPLTQEQPQAQSLIDDTKSISSVIHSVNGGQAYG